MSLYSSVLHTVPGIHNTQVYLTAGIQRITAIEGGREACAAISIDTN